MRLPDIIENLELPRDDVTVQDVHVVKTVEHADTEENLQSVSKLSVEVGRAEVAAALQNPMIIKLPNWKKGIPLGCGCKSDNFRNKILAVNLQKYMKSLIIL